MKRLDRCIVLLLVFALTRTASAAEHAREPLTVFAAASLTDALQKVGDSFTASTGIPVRLSFAASSILAKQIEVGAQADVFFSADQEWMGYLEQRGLVEASSRTELLGNRLALIAPHGSKVALRIAPNESIGSALGPRGRLATGDPDSVPVGRYAKAALISLDQWHALKSRLVRADNVRVALMYVARGEAPLGIVYSTDASVEPRVRIIDLFPEKLHPAITYPVAATRSARSGTEQFLAYLRSEGAQKVFEAAGFEVLDARRGDPLRPPPANPHSPRP